MSQEETRDQGATLRHVLKSGMYPTFLDTHGPSQGIDPRHNNALEYLQRLWTLPLCEPMADETNRYMLKRQAQGLAHKAPPTTAREVWTVSGIILAIGVHTACSGATMSTWELNRSSSA